MVSPEIHLSASFLVASPTLPQLLNWWSFPSYIFVSNLAQWGNIYLTDTHIGTEIDTRSVSAADTIAFSRLGSGLARKAIEIIDALINSVLTSIFLVDGALDGIRASKRLYYTDLITLPYSCNNPYADQSYLTGNGTNDEQSRLPLHFGNC